MRKISTHPCASVSNWIPFLRLNSLQNFINNLRKGQKIKKDARNTANQKRKFNSNERNNKMLILPVICKSSVVPVENYSKICEVVTLTHLREFFRQFYSLLLHLKVRGEIRSKLYINPNCCLCCYQPSE